MSHERTRALLLSALMVLSVAVGSIALSGGAVAATAPTLEGTTPANQSIVHGTTTLTFDAQSADGVALQEVQFDVYGPAAGSVGNNWDYDNAEDRIDFNLPANESVIQEAMDNPNQSYPVLANNSLNTVKQVYGITYIQYDSSTESWSVTINASHDFWSTGEWDWLVKVVDENGNVSAHNNFNAYPNDQDVVTYHVESIQSAVNAASAGDEIDVPAGTYDEEVTIDKALTLRGPDATIRGRMDVLSGPTTVTGFEVGHFEATTAPDGNDGIFISASDVLVENVAVRNITGTGGTVEVEAVHIYSSTPVSNITLDGLDVDGITSSASGADGVKVQYDVDDVTIRDASFDAIHGAWSYGISVTTSDTNPEYPTNVAIEGTTYSNITATTYWGVGVGIDASFGTPWTEPRAHAEEVTVSGSTFADSMDAGVLNKDNHTLVAENNDWGGEPTIGSYADTFANWTRGDVAGAVDYDPWVGEPTPTPIVNEVHVHHHHQASGGGGSQVIERTVTVQGPSPTPREVVRTEVIERTIEGPERTVVVTVTEVVERTVTVVQTPGQPGFGIAMAIVALLGAALLALRRRE